MPRPVVDHDRCNLCEACIELCSALGIDEENDRVVVLERDCGDCSDCAEECPQEAIAMEY